jgi:hypothetical protein
MPTPEIKVATAARPVPSRTLIEGPFAWIGAEMRGREAEWAYQLTPPEIAEIEAAVRAVRRAASAAETFRCRHSARCWSGCAPRCWTAAASRSCAVCLSKIGRSLRARRLIGASVLILAAPAHRTHKGICWGMFTISVKGSAQPTRICAAMRRRNARISILTVATSSLSCACGARSRAGCRRSSAQ